MGSNSRRSATLTAPPWASGGTAAGEGAAAHTTASARGGADNVFLMVPVRDGDPRQNAGLDRSGIQM